MFSPAYQLPRKSETNCQPMEKEAGSNFLEDRWLSSTTNPSPSSHFGVTGRWEGGEGGLQSGNRHTASVPLLPASSHSHPFGHSQLELGVNLLSRPDFPSFQPPCIFQQTCRPTLPSHRNKILNPAQSWHLIIPRFYISNCFTEACFLFVCLFFWCMGC